MSSVISTNLENDGIFYRLLIVGLDNLCFKNSVPHHIEDYTSFCSNGEEIHSHMFTLLGYSGKAMISHAEKKLLPVHIQHHNKAKNMQLKDTA